MANDFSSDSHCVAWYRFEEVVANPWYPLDSTPNANHMTQESGDINANAVTYKEGSQSAIKTANGEYVRRPDADLSSNFPGKNGAGVHTMSACFWVRPTAFNSAYNIIMGKASDCWLIWLEEDGASDWVSFRFNSASHNNELVSVQANQWYHVGVTLDDITKAWRVRVWDDNASTVYDATGTAAGGIADQTDAFQLMYGNATYGMRGYLDEVVIFNDVLTADEIDLIRQGLYGYSSSSSSSSYSSSSGSSSSSSSSDSSSSSFVPPSFPTLSKGVEIDVRETPADADITMPLGNGRTKVRPRYSRRPQRWQGTVRLMSLADYLVLETFYLVTCQRSKYTFEFTDAGTDQTWLVRFDPDAPPSFGTEPQLPEKYHVAFTLLEETIGAYGPGVYGGAYYDS